MKHLKPITDLPELPGFEFIAVDKDGRELPCHVAKMLVRGTFYIAGVTPFTELVGWKPAK